MGTIFWVLLFVLGLILAYIRLKLYQGQKYFESKGIYYLGNGSVRMVKNMYQGKAFQDLFRDQYFEIKSQKAKIAGTKDFGTIAFMISDLDLLKQIFVKDFEHFTDRRKFNVPETDFLFSKMLFSKTGENWRALRTKMSPTFTTGKIRRMFKIFNDSSKKLVKFIESEMSKSGQLDLSNAYSKYTMDVIASAAFGINSQAFDQQDPSLFEEMGKKLQLQFGGAQLLKFITMTAMPKLANFLGWSFFDKQVQDFFMGAISNTIEHRQKTGEVREDFIQLMLQAREGKLKTEESELDNFEKEAIIKDDSVSKVTNAEMADMLDDQGIAANCVLFILGGFDTTQSLLLFAAYALAINPEVQDRLRSEIEGVLEENDGEFTYDSIHKMEYLDMVINESLRYYPPAAGTDRGCTQDYKVPGTDFVIKKGEAILVSTIGIHHDPEFHPEPHKFNPERFSPENKAKMNPYSFMPFGHGPRNCIGMRFAVTEVKLAIAHLVHSFTIEPSEKTLIPMKYQNTGSLKPLGGMWLALNRRH